MEGSTEGWEDGRMNKSLLHKPHDRRTAKVLGPFSCHHFATAIGCQYIFSNGDTLDAHMNISVHRCASQWQAVYLFVFVITGTVQSCRGTSNLFLPLSSNFATLFVLLSYLGFSDRVFRFFSQRPNYSNTSRIWDGEYLSVSCSMPQLVVFLFLALVAVMDDGWLDWLLNHILHCAV